MKYLLVYIWTLLVFVNFGCQEPPPPLTWKSPRQEAEHWFEMQTDYFMGSRQSQYFLSKSLEADPTFARAWMQKALPHLQKGEFAQGFKYLDKAVELNRLEYLGYRGCAKLYYLHDSKGALKDLIELDSMTPNFTDAPWGRDIYYTMGIAEKRRGDLLSAYMYFNRSILNTTKEKGEDWVEVKVFLYRGIVRLELGDATGAIEDFEKGIQYFDKFMEAHYYKGKALLELDQKENACKNFAKAKEFLTAGYSYSNQMYSMTEEVLMDDILHYLNMCNN
ncbi:MAG: hypothetical protein AAFZ15_20660 [Bacteroidota bacterium]